MYNTKTTNYKTQNAKDSKVTSDKARQRHTTKRTHMPKKKIVH